ncbi:thiamine pyrophosphate-binding protein, partial [Salmonella enterica subsp. enterica serovar Kentucky]|nr:thiamine pyrophosphate-binding protein [Salmonella enterica subsp. enterica serovar Kentucky]
YLVRNINELPQVMSDAFRLAQSGRPGPVWIDVPKDVQTATIERSRSHRFAMASVASSRVKKRVEKMKRYTPDFPEMMRLCETNF